MSSSELAQFRLQQIRSLEYQQVLEKENVELKQVILSLRNAPKGDDSKPKLAKLALDVKSWLEKMKLELEQTKGFCALQNTQINFLNETIKENITSMSESSMKKLAEFDHISRENEIYKAKLDEYEKKLNESLKSNLTLHAKVEKLSKELEATKETNNVLKQNSILLNEKVSSLNVQLEESEAKYETCAMELLTLKKKLNKLEAVNSDELQATIQSYQMQILEYEKV